ncbi:hypothetical protein KPL71_021598 [Citrus sinensis]|uniref:Uncharacterized protein n=1 Tax=Citrus sinensis TaxID=2711 RepID=A0ACB8JGZ9_CITSI|nr:hypothetical protein KPL71_021598 [Citrus sinensis]
MLDTRFKQYQDAVIGTVLTTLHAGSVLLTFYPNFNLSLQDPNLPTTLKVQIQIQGAEQISSAKIATLHHQLVYRLQNHALDLPTPEHHSDTLMVLAESDQIPTIIQIPRQIPRHELIKLMPLEWISNYEQFHNNTAPIQTSESMFERRQDGTIRMTFKPPPSAPQEPPRLSFTYSSMITAVQTAQEDLPITGFNSEGYPVYPAKHNGHFLWDAPGSGMCDPNCPCWDNWEDDDDYATTRKKKPKKKKPSVPCHHCDPKPPSDPPPPPAPLPIYRKELKWIAKHCKSEIPLPLPNPTPIVQPLACMMFSSTSSDYSSSFPSLEPHTDPQRNVVSKPFIPSPITSTGHLEPPKPFESVLNWQTQNARAQNDTLLHLNSKVENISLRTEQIETKVDSITAQMQQIYQNLQSRISQLDSELRAMLAHRYSGPEFDQKEREIRRLKAELAQIESEKQRPTLFTTSPPIPSIGPTYHPFASMLSPIKQYDPSKLFGMTHTLFRDNLLPPPPKPKPKPRPQPRPAPLHPSSLTIPGQPSPTSALTSPPAPLFVPTQSKDKEPMHQFTAHTVTHSSAIDDPTSDSNLAVSDSPTETDTESSASTSDSEKSYLDITKILMAQPDQPTQGQTSHTEPYVDIPSEVEEEMHESSATNHPPPAQTNPPSHKSSNGPWFTFDDLPSHKWRDRLNEMSAWIDLQMLRPGATTQSILREFATRFTGALRDWFDSLGQYRQLQFVDLPEVSSALAVLHDQFLGDPSAVFEAARRDYLNMKCCSLNAKDLDFHYKRMSLLFYKLNGFNEPTLKHVFLASLPEELQPNIQRQLTASNLSLDNISLGKIFQLAKTCLDKLCEQKQFFKELLKDKEHFRNPESPTGSSERNLPPPENSNESNQADVSSAREKATMPKIVPTKEKNQSGFDILHQIKHLQIIPTGIRVKSMFKPFTDILKLYNLSETPQSYQDISTKLLSFCPESRSEFTHPNPLWKNKSFFIKLPFKLNEDINPTKATHPGMSPSDLLLAQQECSQLLAQGLIEPTSSQWACQAFYVEKHSEIVRGKKRLVIDYQPLNMFLQDDKFPLPRRQSMFTFLKNAQIFSKFDLKSGFWQLGIEPSERYKTAFCIPNAHFQWTVLPFGSHDEHRQLLTQFYDLIQRHGIMLSAKKSIIATDNVEFLGMIIKDGHYQPGKHIAQELLHFPDQQLSKRQIQQFLGIINYIRDFLPHVDHYTHHLSALLKKKPPEWNADHTFAVTTLKQIAQNPPPLKLITDGKRILQTDASDESWGAILLEELNDKEHFIAYASGHFSDTQKHYHSVFKEILAVKNGIKKFEYHLIGHHFLIRMDSSAFPNIFHFKGKTVPEKMLLRLKDWFSKYDFSVKHIKGSQNLIPDMLSRLSKPENPLTLFSTTYHFPIISMATSLPPEALTKKTFPFNKTFSSVFAIQEFARKALFHFFMKAYLVTDPFPFSTFHPENLFLTGLTLDPTRETTEDVLWYIWCLTILYATQLVLPITPTLEHLLDPDKATSLTWTLLEWFSPIPWWRRKLQQLSELHNLERMPTPEAQMFTSVFIIHRPYFQHPDTKLFWTQDQVYEWFTAPHIAVIENDIQDVLHNYLCQLNHQPPPLKDISHTSLGPQHDLLMIPTPSAISKPKSTGIIIKEEKPDYTDFLFQDSQDPWDAFLPLSQHLHQFPQPTMDEPGPSAPGPSTQSSKRPAQPSKVDKATQTSPKYTPKCTPRDYNCPYPPCRGPSCKHPKLSKTFFQKHPHSGDTDPDETDSSSEDEGISAGNPSLRTTGPKNSFNCCSSGITTPRTLITAFRRRESFSFMASTSSSNPSTPVTLSSTLSLPKSCTSHTTNKIEHLVEYSYIPESAQISESSYPLLSPYHLYKRPSSFTRSIRTLISTRCFTHLHLGGIRLILTLHGRKGLPITARLAMLDTRFKQYQDAVIGTVLTTLHAGSVLLTFYPNFNLSLQDPNLPTTLKVQIQIQGAEQISSAKIATLHHQLVYRLQNHALDLPTPEHHSDTLMVLAESDQISTIIQIPRHIPRHELIKLMPLEWISNYEQFHNNTAPIQTSESMFDRRQDGTVRMTFKPPPSAPQEPPRLSFTYSSMITAVQTAQEDLPITGLNSEGYPVYPAKHNGHFLWDALGSGMCDPNCPCWDDWEEDDDYATTRKKKPKKKKPSVPCHHCDPKPPSDPPPPPAPLPIYRKELKWIAKHCKSEIPSPLPNPTPIVQPLACMMFSSTSSDYSSSFPSLEPHTDPQRNVVSKPFIPSPITSTGHLEPPKPFESVLNWKTQNARAQNDTLLHLNSKVENISLRTEQIETKVDSITAQMQQIYQNLQSRISQLDSELRAMLAHRYTGPEFDQKEREIRCLKAELAQIESEKQRPTIFTTSPPIPSIGPTYHPFASMLSPIKQYDPSKLFGMTHTLFRDNPLPPPPKPKPKPRPQPRPAPLHPSSLTIPGQPSPTSAPTSPPAPFLVPTQSKDKEPMHQFTAHTVDHSSTTDNQTSDSNLAVSDSPTDTDTESSASTSDSEKSYADITKILMAQPDQPDQGQTSNTEPYVDIPSEVEEEMHESSATNQPSPAQTNPPSHKLSNGPWFTFDDLPSHKWRDRLNEMSAWIDLQMLRPGATTQSVLREFATRFTGALRDWFDSLGQYRQLQFVDLPEVSSALAVLHDQFLGDPSAVFEAARRDYLNMKCCSLNARDLDFHYKRMSLLFYKLNGFNEPTLKHVFLASLPEELQPNIQRQLTASNLSLDNISLGKIFQLAKTCLDKLCEQKQFFKELLKDKEPFRSACKKPYLQIKCHKKKDCDCSSKKKRHFRKFKTPEFSSKPRRSRKSYRFFRKKSSSSREFKRKQSSRCFICKRKGHYAKDCPHKREKSIRLVEHLQATTDYSPAKDELEFYFSEQDEPNDETVFALQSSSDSDSDQSQVIFHQQSLSLDTTVPIPSIKLQILPSKFQRPIPAIGLIDTGAQRSMLNPHILPSEYWTQSEEHFKAVNGKLFTTSLITKKPIGIQIFPNCVIWTKVIGSTLPNKDILLGFDILHQIKHLQIIPTGIRVKSMFKPFTNLLKLYNLSETPQSYQDISTKLLSFCPESHSEFTHPNPLWKNKSFFIKLPFKLNEDINPTKATHPGMSPSDLLLAQQECSQLLAQGLIEPTSSQWACQAFYVEKHSEIVRGKKRLVIDYQPLNMFLQDDKFPLPRRQSMFTFLKNAQIFSKFDLKSGFWQLGIEPSERYKTAFCIPNAHFQWTVLPFGLKTAPSIFQKSMVQIFQPILYHELIYIDDILLFSGSHDDHRQLLTQFYDLIHSHGIMLSARKIIIATDNVEFLGMIKKDGHYQPGKHIAQELLHFPDQQLSKRQIQQFLGIINYIRDFIPHVDHYTHHLSALLKKKPPEWTADHTTAVTTLKQIAQNPPPLKLITDGKRILQTDAIKHIKGSQNLIPDMLSRLSKPEHPLTLFSTTYHFPIISMATSLPPEALTKKTFPFNKTFSSVFAIQEFARKALFRFFMKAYLVTDPFPFSTFHPENLFLTGLTLDPTRETTEDVLWYIWCLTILYATKLDLPITPTLEHLLDPDKATSLTWTLLEWFSPIPWWRRKLKQLSEIYNLERMPTPEAQMFTSVFIIHRPYFQHPDTKLFWTQDQVYEWFTAPHIAVIENDIQDVLHNYLCQLNHQPPPLKDISHTSLGPQHDLLMIPTPSAISKLKCTGIIIREEKPDYTDFLFQDSQDPWDAFLPLSQHLHQFPQPTMDEPGPSAPGPSTQSSKRPAQPSKVDKATQTSPQYTPKGISAGNPSLRTTGPKNSFNCCSSGITTPQSSDSEDISVISTVQNVNHVSTIPRPSLKMLILPSKFHKPVPVIGFIDTGADTSMIDPFVLPSDYWEPHSKLFRAVNGETFETTLITKKPIGLTLSSLSICEDELWYMWCLTTLYATKLVFPIKPVLTHLTNPEFSPDLLWTLFEWYSPLTWPYFQHPETRNYWTQDMAYEWRTYPHLYTLIHDTSVTSILKAYLMELNNVPPPATNIHHTSIGPSHTLEIIPKAQGCTMGSSSSPQGILVMEQRPDYTNVLFQDAQGP